MSHATTALRAETSLPISKVAVLSNGLLRITRSGKLPGKSLCRVQLPADRVAEPLATLDWDGPVTAVTHVVEEGTLGPAAQALASTGGFKFEDMLRAGRGAAVRARDGMHRDMPAPLRA